ncbi:putative T6SS immunity periplasmic lipoprotein [Brenneria corticis]|nr:putative T6SS immunity periplasmic lipoprotein [Brenneria sp. CFCC 11842]
MKRKMAIALIGTLSLTLTGCHLGDPRAKHYRASVTTISDNVCVMIQPEKDENIVSLIISEIGRPENKLEKFDAISVSSDKCVPDFGYKYEMGHAYNFSVILESPEKKGKGIIPASRIFGVDFSLWKNNGKLEASPLN